MTPVFWAHDVMRGQHWTERWAKRTPPDLVIANSRLTAASVSAVFPSAPVSVVYAPVALPSAESMAAHRDAVRAELETAPTAIVVVQASRMEPWKGQSVLLEALSWLRDRDDWVCWMVGAAQRPEEATFAESLRASARTLGIEDRVRFAGARTDIPRVLAAADIHCQPNLEPEPFGIAFVEALSAGLPVVTSATGGALEIVDSSCGMLVPAGDSAAFANALRTLIDDEPTRARLAAAAPARARALCDPTRQIHALHAALTTIAVPVAART
jgi:glycosyltransferase involved in cell wall biosynthesis